MVLIIPVLGSWPLAMLALVWILKDSAIELDFLGKTKVNHTALLILQHVWVYLRGYPGRVR